MRASPALLQLRVSVKRLCLAPVSHWLSTKEALVSELCKLEVGSTHAASLQRTLE